jgi:hypothetical protein
MKIKTPYNCFKCNYPNLKIMELSSKTKGYSVYLYICENESCNLNIPKASFDEMHFKTSDEAIENLIKKTYRLYSDDKKTQRLKAASIIQKHWKSYKEKREEQIDINISKIANNFSKEHLTKGDYFIVYRGLEEHGFIGQLISEDGSYVHLKVFEVGFGRDTVSESKQESFYGTLGTDSSIQFYSSSEQMATKALTIERYLKIGIYNDYNYRLGHGISSKTIKLKKKLFTHKYIDNWKANKKLIPIWLNFTESDFKISANQLMRGNDNRIRLYNGYINNCNSFVYLALKNAYHSYLDRRRKDILSQKNSEYSLRYKNVIASLDSEKNRCLNCGNIGIYETFDNFICPSCGIEM